MNKKIRILYFIGTLQSGGKERRLVELLSYLKGNHKYELMLILKHANVDYPAFYQLGIPYQILKLQWKVKDPTLFYQFYKICKQYNPDIIHVWGHMPAFYALPASIIKGIPLINNQVTSAPPKIKRYSFKNIVNQINFMSSTIIISNSKAGLDAYKLNGDKSKIIPNGINLSRFRNLPPVEEIKRKYNINTRYSVIMVASVTIDKNYKLFLKVAKLVTKKRNDISFIGVGGNDDKILDEMRKKSMQNYRIKLPGKIYEVEALVNACDIGILFSNEQIHGEGISNAILEYMALGKPVIANDAGGTREIVEHGKNGLLLTDETPEQIAQLIQKMINDTETRRKMGEDGKNKIERLYTIDKMGMAFESVYHNLINNTQSESEKNAGEVYAHNIRQR